MDNDKDALSRRMARTALLMDAAALERLRTSHVMLFGLGGVGSYAAEALARRGHRWEDIRSAMRRYTDSLDDLSEE